MLSVKKFTNRGGVRFYQIPMVVFPNGFVAYSYLVFNAGPLTLIDAGSGFEDSNKHLLEGIQTVADTFGEKFKLSDIERIIVTHGHLDHYGGVKFMMDQTGALVGVHDLDRRVLTNYEERLIMATKDLTLYLERAGINEVQRAQMIEMYGFAKQHIVSVDVGFDLDEEVMYEGMRFYHVPGHCPGQVCIQIGEVMITADHILSRTTPHQAPESITHYTGLGHYRDSLRKIAHVDGIELGLSGHEAPIEDVYQRIEDILTSHDRKLNRVLDIMKTANIPLTIKEITDLMYPDMNGYETLLALEEAGAHIEYLYQHGAISVANLTQVEQEDNPALQYVVI